MYALVSVILANIILCIVICLSIRYLYCSCCYKWICYFSQYSVITIYSLNILKWFEDNTSILLTKFTHAITQSFNVNMFNKVENICIDMYRICLYVCINVYIIIIVQISNRFANHIYLRYLLIGKSLTNIKSNKFYSKRKFSASRIIIDLIESFLSTIKWKWVEK